MSRKDKINRKEIDKIDYTPCCEITASDGIIEAYLIVFAFPIIVLFWKIVFSILS